MTYDERDFNANLMHSFCNYMFTNGWVLSVIDTEYGEDEIIADHRGSSQETACRRAADHALVS